MAARKRKPETADTRTFRAPSVRTFQEWTPRKIRLAERQAEAGDLSYAVAVCEWLLGDDDVAGALDARLDALFGLIPSFEPGAGRRKNQAVKALEAGEDWWASYPEAQNRLLHRWGLLLGIAPAAHRWGERADHGGRWLPKPRFWHPSTLRQDQQTLEWTICNALHQRVPVVAGDGTWILHTPFGDDRPQMMGLWRSLARWVLLKHMAMQDAGKHSEQASKTVVTAPDNASRQQRQEVAEDIFNSGEDAVIALAAGFDAKQLETSANFSNIYKPLVELASSAVRIRIRGGNLSSNVEGGSLAAAKSQAETSERPKLRFDAEAFATTIHDQSLTWWAEYNFGARRLAPWPTYPVEPEEDRKATGESEEKALSVLDKAESLGLEVDREKFLETYGIGWAKAGTRPEAPPPPPPGFGAPPFPGQQPRQESDTSPVVALASGAPVAENSGFVEGQLYVDALVEHGTARMAEALEPDLKTVRDLVMQAKDYDDLRAKLREAYAGLSPEKLSSIMERALILGELAGRVAALQDL